MQCDVIFLAVKPHLFSQVVAGLEIDGISGDANKKAEEAGASAVLSPQTR